MKQNTYSVYSSVVHSSHREFYEEIMGKLRGTSVICALGRCKALEVSKSQTDHDVITSLMRDVEKLSDELMSITKRLFERFYKSKEDFYCRAMLSTSACKIDLMDRNLLERTCDVRWWSLEIAFCDCLSTFETTEQKFEDILRQLTHLIGDTVNPEEETATASLKTYLKSELESGLATFFLPKQGTKVIEFIEKALDEGLVNSKLSGLLLEAEQDISKLHEKIDFACLRLEDVVSAYTLYRDLVITNKKGFVIANANPERRKGVLGKLVAGEKWFQEAMKTKNGTEYYAQDFQASCVEEVPSLVYSTAVREGGDTQGNVVGTMGVFFDFQGEAALILNDYMPTSAQGVVSPGWYSLITSKSNAIIGSSDPYVFRLGEQTNDTAATKVLKQGETFSDHLQIHGNPSLLASVRTSGYLEYPGLEWCCHVIMPESDIFAYHETNQSVQIDKDQILDSKLVPTINKEAFALTKATEGDIQDISINGIIIANKIGRQAQSLTPIFDSITEVGEFATRMMEDLLLEMAYDQLNHNYESLMTLAKQAIDLIDRNLFERSADIRWWATDQAFHQTLEDPTPENCQKASARLQVINQSYTMYRDLVLLNTEGSVIASANDAMRGQVQMVNVVELDWFRRVMETTLSSEYEVADVADSLLEPMQNRSLIYTAGVRENGARRGKTIGAVAIMFDWQEEAGQMLTTCLPQNLDGSVIEGCFAVYTNHSHEVIEATECRQDLLGKKLDLPDEHLDLKNGETTASTVKFEGKTYVVGTARTQGYREYAGLAWLSHVFRPFD